MLLNLIDRAPAEVFDDSLRGGRFAVEVVDELLDAAF